MIDPYQPLTHSSYWPTGTHWSILLTRIITWSFLLGLTFGFIWLIYSIVFLDHSQPVPSTMIVY